jgi:hypothetical protein
MESGHDKKNMMKGIALYITVAVLFVVLVLLSAWIDEKFLIAATPYGPAETATEILFIVLGLLYVRKHGVKSDKKMMLKCLPFAAVPLVLSFFTFFYIPDTALPLHENIAYFISLVLVSVSEDVVLCALGCTILIHRHKMRSWGVAIMLICMAARELMMSVSDIRQALFSAIIVLFIGYFEIIIHLCTKSALYGAALHFLLSACIRITDHYSEKETPAVGGIPSLVLTAVLLIALLGSGIYLRQKLIKEERAKE